jgi:putative protease
MRARRPEVLAPAGDRAGLEAAVRGGADAVYFGLTGWNARARAANFTMQALPETMALLHRHGVKGYVALNTLVFDDELAGLEQAVRGCARAGVDAVIVQDLGVARLVRRVAPELSLHASTQMTCTDAAGVELARSLGAKRVVLARELSLEDIAAIRRDTDVELEVFVHGALCISYSGQCLTSEAIGGRSANRGACAQACRLPYELIVDGQRRELGDQAFLLSPEDLEAARLVPRLVELGVSALKIEGRLKEPAYVTATTRLYREAIAAALGEGAAPSEQTRQTALQMYSRGSGPGFLDGVDHQRLVAGTTCEHRGILLGVSGGARRWKGTAHLAVDLQVEVARGDGIVVAGGRAGAGELGGRVWRIVHRGREVERAPAGTESLLWLGPDVDLGRAAAGRSVHRTSDPAAERRVRLAQPATIPLDVRVHGVVGAPPRFEAEARGHVVAVAADTALVSGDRPLDPATVRAQLGRLGGTPFHLGALSLDLPAGAGVPVSALNRVRRALLEALGQVMRPRPQITTSVSAAQLLAEAMPPGRPPPPGGLLVLCRNVEQAQAALAAGADGVYLDLLELTGTGQAFRALAPTGLVGLAPPRIRKPGEEKIDRYLRALQAPAVLVRGLGALHELATTRPAPLAIGDFSLNVTNRLAAVEVLGRGLDAFTPAFDLDGVQLRALCTGALAPFAEVVVHHPMPLFHMEHCLIAAVLSDGADYRTCGRPCERHQVSLRDRAAMDHPVEADVGCRNTVFHAAAQSAADLVPALTRQGVRRFRIELVRERPADVDRIVRAYRDLLGGTRAPSAIWRELGAAPGCGVVRGSLRVLA